MKITWCNSSKPTKLRSFFFCGMASEVRKHINMMEKPSTRRNKKSQDYAEH